MGKGLANTALGAGLSGLIWANQVCSQWHFRELCFDSFNSSDLILHKMSWILAPAAPFSK